MRITIIQDNILWEQPSSNINQYEFLLASNHLKTDLIILPEMFTTGFSMNCRTICQPENDNTLAWMQNMAKTHQSAIVGSVMHQEGEKYYNRLYFVLPEGTYFHYDKKHLFRMADEHLHYTPGTDKLIISYKGWRICPMVCYDLRFPVFSRNKLSQGVFDYDLLLYVANWPEVRRSAWNTLLPARAHENLSYVVGVNRIGVDGNQKSYSGDSNVYSFKGEKILESTINKAFIETITLSKQDLEDYRAKFNSLLDDDSFMIS